MAIPIAIFGLDRATDGALSHGGGAAAKEAVAKVGGGGAVGNLMAMLGLRSPGERAAGALVDTKARPPAYPTADVMSERDSDGPYRPAGNVGRPGIIPPPALAEVAPPDVPILRGLTPLGAPPTNPSNPPVIIPTPPGFPPGGGGGVVIPPSTPLPPNPPITPPSGVPEPETWAMMVLGFGMAGAAMRRRNRRDRRIKGGLKGLPVTTR